MRYGESKEVEIPDADEYRLLWRGDAPDLLHENPQKEEEKVIDIHGKNLRLPKVAQTYKSPETRSTRAPIPLTDLLEIVDEPVGRAVV